MEGQTVNPAPPMEGRLLPNRFMSFDDVQDRLVEAMLTCWRYPDRERGWQAVRCAWPEMSREAWDADHDASTSADVALRVASQTREDIAEMEEAFGWLDAVAPDDRKLIGLAITELARGKREVPWRSLMPNLGVRMGVTGVQMRYSRTITAICNAVNRTNPSADVSRG